MEKLAIKLDDKPKCIGGTMHYAYRCPECKRKYSRRDVRYSASCPNCKTQLKLKE